MPMLHPRLGLAIHFLSLTSLKAWHWWHSVYDDYFCEYCLFLSLDCLIIQHFYFSRSGSLLLDFDNAAAEQFLEDLKLQMLFLLQFLGEIAVELCSRVQCLLYMIFHCCKKKRHCQSIVNIDLLLQPNLGICIPVPDELPAFWAFLSTFVSSRSQTFLAETELQKTMYTRSIITSVAG